MKFSFQVASVTFRVARTLPVQGSNGQSIPYSSDVTDLTLAFTPVPGDPIVKEVETTGSDEDALQEALAKLGKLVTGVCDAEVVRRETEDRYQIGGLNVAPPKVVAL